MVIKSEICEGGPELSRIILGGWRWNDRSFPLSAQHELVNKALELGITTFDHADIYGNYHCQFKFGELLKTESGLREKIQIITKCGIKPVSGKFPERKIPFYDTSSAHIIKSVEDSLVALKTDYVDVLLIHRPDPLLNPDEVAEAFTQLKAQGKVNYFGVSNFTNEQFSLLQSRLELPLVTNQIELSLSHNSPLFDGTLDYLLEHKVYPMAWSPFGGGKIFKNKELMDRLNVFCKKYNISIATLLIAWLIHLPSRVFPVVGTLRPERLGHIAAGLEVEFERQDWYHILKDVRGYNVP
ncbi:MAG: aldo/keto reductase [Cyclobacteriaceae bacterium]|nr:aldo/keto reductase [Cyclobacteriaceae bacterium]